MEKIITLRTKDGSILYEGKAEFSPAGVRINAEDLDFELDLTSEGPVLKTRENLEMELDLRNQGRALIETPYGTMEAEAGLAGLQQDENSLTISYWVGNPEEIQTFIIEEKKETEA